MSVQAEPIDHQVELNGVLLAILKELKMIRLMIAEQNNSSLQERDVDV